ncbi:MAG: phosphonate ABC transporter, permease protein PhnE [Cyanothece sp. SIO2G6]|nr:phosphonate ABC transporter, permease protein PhnE [Cyanothece sp. SIO2G6]
MRIFWAVVAIAILIHTGEISDLSFGELFEGRGRMVTYISGYWFPDFTDSGLPRLSGECPSKYISAPFLFNLQLCIPTAIEGYVFDIIQTVGMGIWGTLISAIVAIPLSIIAAENVAPFFVVFIIRIFLGAMRVINEFVFALIFIVAVGLGPFAGVLALFVHTTGTLGKLFSEAIEEIEPGPVDGIRATGASKLQEVIFGVLPQVLPLWTSYTLYRFEANIRSAAVLGLVGAGGIGLTLFQSMRSFQNQKVAAILILLTITVVGIDTISAKIRQRLV